MESVIQTAFQELDTASDLVTVQLGLDRIDQLFSDLCKPKGLNSGKNGQHVSAFGSTEEMAPAPSLALQNNPQYRTYLSLQSQFNYNICTKLVPVLKQLIIIYRNIYNSLTVTSIIQGQRRGSSKWTQDDDESIEDEERMDDSRASESQFFTAQNNPKSPASMFSPRKTRNPSQNSYLSTISNMPEVMTPNTIARSSKLNNHDNSSPSSSSASNRIASQTTNSSISSTSSSSKFQAALDMFETPKSILEKQLHALESMTLETLELMQGSLLLHHPSRSIFASKSSLFLLLEIVSTNELYNPFSNVSTSDDKLEEDEEDEEEEIDENVILARYYKSNPSSCIFTTSIQIAAINTLVSAMVREPSVIRQFENCNGLNTITKLFKQKETPKDVKLRILEFLFFYLIPETQKPTLPTNNKSEGDKENNSISQLSELSKRKNTKDKSALLRHYLGNVDGLIQELEISKPFGELDNIEW